MGTVLQTGTGEEVPRPVLLSLFFFSFALCIVEMRKKEKSVQNGVCARVGAVLALPLSLSPPFFKFGLVGVQHSGRFFKM